MANYQLLKADIDAKVYQNGKQEITGENLNSILNQMVTTLGAEYQFAGVATTATNPGTPDAKVFYIANGKGTYTNFGGLEVTEDEVVVLYWDSSWHKEATGIASNDKLTELEEEVSDKVNVKGGVNLIYKDAFTLGYGLSPTGVVTRNKDLNLSGFIPVEEQDIVANGYNSEYWRAGVYDANHNWLRAITSNYYTYQSGDVYLRVNFLATESKPRANYGTTLYPYETFNPVEAYIKDSNSINGLVDSVGFLTITSKDAKIGYEFESGSFSLSTMEESDDNTRLRSNILRVDNGRVISINVPDGYQYIFSASADGGTTWVQQNTWTTPKSLVAKSELGFTLVRYLVRKSNLSLISKSDSLLFQIRLDGELVDLTELKAKIEVRKALGLLTSFGTPNSEVLSSAVANGTHSYEHKSSFSKPHKTSTNKRIVAVNHDDLPIADYEGTRKIYNKYDFHANFNYILMPFKNSVDRDLMVKNVKEMIADGHEIGFHAYFNSSSWIKNKLFDVRPDGSATFAPNANELRPIGVSGVNAFKQAINSTTTFRNLGYVNPPTSLENVPVINCTQAQVNELTQHYCVFTQVEDITGIDLDGNIVTKTRLEWAEYYYYNLIDKSLGFSTKGTIAERFAADYDMPSDSSYPDEAHLLSGKVAAYNVITSEQIANGYQSCGVFTRGLFKGCLSTRNCEVIDRIIAIATAVAKHYFGLDHFTNFGRHGVQYAEIYWTDSNGYPYDNRGLSVLHHERGLWYNTFYAKYMSAYDALVAYGIKMCNHSNIFPAKYEGQSGLYFGQKGIRDDKFSDIVNGHNGMISFLQLLGKDGDVMSYSSFINFFGDKPNWIKYAYDNAGKTITGANGSQILVSTNFKTTIDVLRALKDTNKIPVLSYDTIKDNASCQVAIELLCRYCYLNDIKIVTLEEARQMAIGFGLDFKNNHYPNPSFNQSLIDQFGEFDSIDAYLPDSMLYVGKVNVANPISIGVSVEDSKKVLSMTNVISDVRLYGLPSGRYRFSVMGKGKGTLFILLNKNKDLAFSTSNLYARAAAYLIVNSTDWAEHTFEFTIEEPFFDKVDSTSAMSMLNNGGENNIANVEILYYGNATNQLSIHSPKIVAL